MQSIRKHIIILVLIAMILSVPMSVSATVPVSSGYSISQHEIIIAMHYEDVSPIGHIQAELEQDLIALEHAFGKLQNEGLLDSAFPRLVIEAYMYYEVEYRLEIAPTILSRTDTAVLVSSHPDVMEFDPMNLGPAYVIKTSPGLLSFEDLAAMLIHLVSLNDTEPEMKIESEEQLMNAKTHSAFEKIMNARLEKDEEIITSGNLRISTRWDAGETQYSIIDAKGGTVNVLEPADIYIGRPSWPPSERIDMQGRLIAYASKDKAIIHDLAKGKNYELNLDFEYKDSEAIRVAPYIEYQRIGFAMHAEENKVYVLPFGTMGMIMIVYSLDLDTGKWLREMEGSPVSDLVWRNKHDEVWLDFVPAITVERIGNIDVLTREEEIAIWTKYRGLVIEVDDEMQPTKEDQPLNDPQPDGAAADVQEAGIKEGAPEGEETPVEDAVQITDENMAIDDANVERGLLSRAWWILMLILPAAALFVYFKNRRKA